LVRFNVALFKTGRKNKKKNHTEEWGTEKVFSLKVKAFLAREISATSQWVEGGLARGINYRDD